MSSALVSSLVLLFSFTATSTAKANVAAFTTFPPPPSQPIQPSCACLHMALTRTTARTFQFVKYGSSYDASSSSSSSGKNRPTISCDGRISCSSSSSSGSDNTGVTLELTHWTDNQTPAEYYADTSTEMALLLPPSVLSNAVVLNNHYDTDGVLSVFACLEPAVAQQYATILKAGAEAGDFGEWSINDDNGKVHDLGIKLDAILSAIGEDYEDEAVAYQDALEELPLILKDLVETGGKDYINLWKPVLDHAYESWQELETGDAALETIPVTTSQMEGSNSNDDGQQEQQLLAILTEPANLPISPFALHRGLVETGVMDQTTRVLRVMERFHNDYDMFRYVYEKPGHGWVQKLVDRPSIPLVDADRLVASLNAQESKWGNPWKTGGPSGLVSICFTNELPVLPDEVVTRLTKMEADILATSQ